MVEVKNKNNGTIDLIITQSKYLNNLGVPYGNSTTIENLSQSEAKTLINKLNAAINIIEYNKLTNANYQDIIAI